MGPESGVLRNVVMLKVATSCVPVVGTMVDSRGVKFALTDRLAAAVQSLQRICSR